MSWRPDRPTAGDVVRAAVAAAVCLAILPVVYAQDGDDNRGFDAILVVLIVAACAPIAVRRSAPIAAALVSLSFSLAGFLATYPMTGPILVALGLVTLATSRAGHALFLGACSAIVLAIIAAFAGDGSHAVNAVGGLVVGASPALLGDRLRAERLHTRDARELARRIEELRDQDVQRAVAEERLRIVRDVHDITGHHLSAIALQAGGAGRMTSDPLARGAFERIHALTTEALGQTRRALGMLREESEPLALVPAPRLAHVEHLLEPARAAGIAVDLHIDGGAHQPSEAAEVCAYRVIQESLTNVVRHAGADSVRIAVGYGVDTMTVTVEDDGRGDPARPPRPAGGIAGMRERAVLAGGELSAGPRADGGWSVRATLPLEGPA